MLGTGSKPERFNREDFNHGWTRIRTDQRCFSSHFAFELFDELTQTKIAKSRRSESVFHPYYYVRESSNNNKILKNPRRDGPRSLLSPTPFPSNLQLENKTALVTGSTKGIGFAIAQALAKEGAKVFVNGRKHDSTLAAAQKIGNGARGIAADVSTAEGCADLVRQLPEVDILVNNAGIFEPKPLISGTEVNLRLKTGHVLEQGPKKVLNPSLFWNRDRKKSQIRLCSGTGTEKSLESVSVLEQGPKKVLNPSLFWNKDQN